ncbi:MAG: hypothetical protein QG597_2403 [Actinomycetota bacterium]|nr:hypothetical protein [Actinomycetota bacterium]
MAGQNSEGNADATEPLAIEDPTAIHTPVDPTTVQPAAGNSAAEDATAVHAALDHTAVMPAVPAPPLPARTPPPLPPPTPVAASAPIAAPAAATGPAGAPTAAAVDKPWPWLGKIIYWGFVGWIVAYAGVLGAAFTVQFVEGEFPCPLCMLQRYAMILSSLAAMWIVMQARRGTLTMGRYAQGLGLGLLAALAGSVMSGRQVLLHILPGDPGYGSAVLGLHLYTWALVTFFIVALFCAVSLILMPRAVATAPGTSWLGRIGGGVTMIVVWLFLILIAANVVAIIFLEGAAWVLPDDPTSYNLLDQLGITGS